MTGPADSYRDARGVRDAISAAARAAADPQRSADRLAREAYFDRFLCRVFTAPEPVFVLKGGTGMLARLPTARTTRDIDLAAEQDTISGAVEALIAAAGIDLGDHLRFQHLDTVPLLEGAGQPYTDGVRVRFDTYLGVTKAGPVSVDLVLAHPTVGHVVVRAPANRLPLPRLRTVDYRLYPLEDQVADKVCASHATYGPTAAPSSRVKDLVDLALIARTEQIDGCLLTRALEIEQRRRNQPAARTFTPPAAFGRGWRAEAARGNLHGLDLISVVVLVSDLVNPALEHRVDGRTWMPAHAAWSTPSHRSPQSSPDLHSHSSGPLAVGPHQNGGSSTRDRCEFAGPSAASS